jgi:hypothetical protein
MENEKQLAQKLLQTLKKVLKQAQYIKQPRGRPRRVMKVEQQALPSKIKRKYKTLASRVAKYTEPKLYPVIEEYKQLLYKMLEKDPKYSKTRARQRVADIHTFRYRKPTKREKELIGTEILPSRIFDKKITSSLDIELYKQERKDELDIDRYSYKVSQLHEEMNLDKALREIKEKLVSSLITRQTKYGFYIHINLKCFFHNTKTDEDIEFYVGSLTHRRDEVYVSRREELHKVISLCLEEIKNRIYSRECTESGFTFKTIDEVYVSLFRYHGNKLIQITQ